MPRRAQPGLLLILMAAAVAVVAVTVAPCAAPAAACTLPCAPSISAPKQCLHFLQESHKDELCGPDLSSGRRRTALANLRFRHCCEHRVVEALPETAFRDTRTCRLRLQELLETDDLAHQASCSYSDLLLRYDCGQNYSIAFNCDHCKVAYRRWVCSELVPFYGKGGGRVPPCLHFCQDVEQQCPYLLPDQTLTPSEAAHPTPQYAGEPNFLCLDPNIPRLEQRPNTTTGDEDCCYSHCGAPGRGDVYVCANCPGRPANGTTEAQVRPRSTTSGTRTSIVSRWMLWTVLLLTLRPTNLLNCFLTGTANSVRTVPECC
ncbi:NALCN channel auxiliary factor 1 [Euwallacea fornicatus]|uniref:NALCN channel auxiliary factor 1 n=1 Tax=Euwallacea fornicatus TaxID=995702 RepID=UPI00338E727C